VLRTEDKRLMPLSSTLSAFLGELCQWPNIYP
jgi:hypothetical protein